MAPSRTGFMEMLLGPGVTSMQNAFPPAPTPTRGGGLLDFMSSVLNPTPQSMMMRPRRSRGPQSGFGQLLDLDVAMPMAAALLGNEGNAGNFARAFASGGAALKKNQTVEMIRQKDPELAELVDFGLEPGDALRLFYDRQKLTAQGPKAPQVETFYDANGAAYKAQWNPKINDWQKVGGSKAGEGFEVSLPDGTTVRQGALGSQDKKNTANRIAEEQDATKVASQLKATVGVMRQANQNTGYSGPGSGVYGAVDDTLEQFGYSDTLPGTAGARATMRAGSLDAALANVAKTKGAISNAEMELFQAAAPGMSQTPQGNAAMLDMLDAIADRQMMRAESMETWRRDHGNLDGFETAWGEYVSNNPLLAPDGQGGVSLSNPRAGVAAGPNAGGAVNRTKTGTHWRVK